VQAANLFVDALHALDVDTDLLIKRWREYN
jgi:hypothetical protein